MGHKIAGIIFDLGGVLVALDGGPSLAKLLGIEPQHDALHAMWIASPSVLAHETGKIEAAAFAAGVVADLGLPVTADWFLQDFRNWPTGLLPGALQLLDEIPDAYHVAALSNTSAVHWEKIREMGLAGRFDQTYLSHQIGYLKPATEAFSAALEGMGLSASDVVFLDDRLPNIDAALKVGMHAHLVRGPEEARRALAQYGIVPSTRNQPLPDSGERVRLALERAGVAARIVELPQSARTAAEAAAGLGCEVAQIAKSLVFRGAASGRAVLVIASGTNRVDEALVAKHIGEAIGKADAAFVRAATGYAIGGVPPLAHTVPIETLFDEDLLQYEAVWAAAGTPHAVFSASPGELVRATGARVLRVKASR